MAKPGGIFKYKGTLDDISSYDSVYGPIVRVKGGPTAEQIKNSPEFERTRENNEELTECAKCGKLWRTLLLPYTRESPDHRLVPRVTQLMAKLKNLDEVSERGKRLVSNGLGTAEGRALMSRFHLTSEAPLDSVLKTTYLYKDGRFSVEDLVPRRDLKAPKGSTHVRFSLAVSLIDFNKGEHAIAKQETIIPYDRQSQDLDLTVSVLTGTGFTVAVIQICFLQEVNGELYPLANQKMNCMSVVGVE